MKICAISDLHGYLPSNINVCDILLISGDIFPLEIQSNMPASELWLLEDFIPWASQLSCNKVIVIAGNHDFWFERNDVKAHRFMKSFDKVTYLKNELFTYVDNNGKECSIFGTPYCKIFGHWAFMREPETLMKKFDELPENVDILLSHDAPYGINDIILEDVSWADGKHIGNPQLAIAILEKHPKYNIHGHLHSTAHTWETAGYTKVINVSLKNERYQPIFEPLYFDIL